MLAPPERARSAAWERKGHPAQNWTGVARAKADHRAQGSCIHPIDRTMTATPSGPATSTRPSHIAWYRSSASAGCASGGTAGARP